MSVDSKDEAMTSLDELSLNGEPGHSSSCSDDDIVRTATAIGILSNGTRFPVPETMSVMTALVQPRSWKSPATLVWTASWMAIALTSLLHMKGVMPLWFFCAQFAFWRLAYNVGLGLLLHRQSTRSAFLELYKTHVAPNKGRCALLESSVVLSAAEAEYKVSRFPDEFNAWMLFRIVVNVVLANDLISYIVLALVCWETPDLTSPLDILCTLVGLGSIVFALWSKADAHRVIGDYAWYWGDFFFLLDTQLVFDGIFQMFPHPMYTVGYTFMYGVPLMAKSYVLFYMSVFGHLAQLIFLASVENPHIDKTYNQIVEPTEEERARDAILYGGSDSELSGNSFLQRDELVVLKNFSIFRAADVLLASLLLYIALTAMAPLPAWFYVVQAVVWRIVLNGVLGWVLRQQSMSAKWITQRYRTSKEAFQNWKKVYNTAVTATNVTYAVCAAKLFQWDTMFVDSTESRSLIFVVGVLLVLINVYVSHGIYEAIGDFGYYFGDFFIDDLPAKLTYSGIYRYMNNPDSSLGMSGYYGVALMSGSPLVLALALFSHACSKLFQELVEAPHMQHRYGNEVRDAGGLKRELQNKLTLTRQEYERSIQRLKGEIESRRQNYERFLRERNARRGRRSTNATASAAGGVRDAEGIRAKTE